MSRRSVVVVGASVVVGAVIGASSLVFAQFNPWNNNSVNMRAMTDNWGAPSHVAQLASNEGIFVDVKEFKIAKGMAKGDPAEQIRKSGAKEAPDGAIIFRSGNKLYIVDGRPPAATTN